MCSSVLTAPSSTPKKAPWWSILRWVHTECHSTLCVSPLPLCVAHSLLSTMNAASNKADSNSWIGLSEVPLRWPRPKFYTKYKSLAIETLELVCSRNNRIYSKNSFKMTIFSVCLSVLFSYNFLSSRSDRSQRPVRQTGVSDRWR